METELLELFESVKRAADAAADGASSNGPEVDRCIDALKTLKKFPVSYDALLSAQVGKRLRQITKHPVGKIQSAASDLLEMWKKIVIEETTRDKKNSSLDTKSSTKTETGKTEAVKVQRIDRTSSIKVEVSAKQLSTINKGDSANYSRSESVKIEKKVTDMSAAMVEKKPKEEKQVSGMKKPSQTHNGPPKLSAMIKCNDAVRDKVRELLAEALSKVYDEADDDIRDEVNACDAIRVAVQVESVMFEKLGRSNGTQKFKYRSIMFNVKDPNNPDLRRKVLLGQVKPERLCNMTAEEMASEQRKLQNNQIKEKALFDCERGGPPKATTDQFKCGRCGQRKCTYYQLQTRSADEPMTTFVTCVNCNNHWKFC
ncbi:Transcription factor IIS, N-terminal [Dillenia turbinata]|uniref:Transcription elongation factor n=1 Tax=Dillenia turbinata TaxID=194707 RepID=A0AAN8ZQQ2_9MAGN